MNTEQNGAGLPDTAKITAAKNLKTAKIISLDDVISRLDKPQREKLISGHDIKNFAKIFEDAEMMRTVDGFLQNGMNVSEAARELYMHRNTLIYRLNAIRRKTGLDLRNFDMAVTFRLLHILYRIK